MNGYECLQCELAESQQDSFFCSPACRDAFAAASNGPVRCDLCDAETETIAESLAAGWTQIANTPEGFGWNQQGLCKNCSSVSVEAKAC